MKKNLIIIILLIICSFQLSAQKIKDVLYLRNGSIIYGKLLEINENEYKIQTSDGSMFIYPVSDVDRFVKEVSPALGRKSEGFGLGMEAGLLIGSQNSGYVAPFSFNFMAGYTFDLNNIISLGSGVEFIGVPFSPVFIEYRYLMNSKRASPFLFARGGGLLFLGDDNENSNNNYQYEKKDYKGGFSGAFGTGISWSKEDIEPYLSFAYRFASTSYVQMDNNNHDITYKNAYNRLELKFGFRF
jgi:hypothetical protein